MSKDYETLEELLNIKLNKEFKPSKDFNKTFTGSWNGKKWNELFESEEELIHYASLIEVEKYNMYNHGRSYMESFVKILKSGDSLNTKQLTQLKRMSQDVYKYHVNISMGLY